MAYRVPHLFDLWCRFGRVLRARGFDVDYQQRIWSKQGPFERAEITLDDTYPVVHLRMIQENGELAVRSTVDLSGTDEADWDNLVLPFDQEFDLPTDD